MAELLSATGEESSDDFNERLSSINLRFSNLIAPAMAKCVSDSQSDLQEPPPRVTVFSPSLEKAVVLIDVGWPNNNRNRMAMTYPAKRGDAEIEYFPPKPGQGFIVKWVIDNSDVVPGSFRDTENVDREVALGNLAEVLNDPDLDVVA